MPSLSEALEKGETATPPPGFGNSYRKYVCVCVCVFRSLIAKEKWHEVGTRKEFYTCQFLHRTVNGRNFQLLPEKHQHSQIQSQRNDTSRPNTRIGFWFQYRHSECKIWISLQRLDIISNWNNSWYGELHLTFLYSDQPVAYKHQHKPLQEIYLKATYNHWCFGKV